MANDHIPSFAAIKKYVESTTGVKLSLPELRALRQNSLTMTYENKIHQTVSRTFGGRNNPLKIAEDAANLPAAIKKDIKELTPSLLKAGYTQGEINTAQQSLMEKYIPK